MSYRTGVLLTTILAATPVFAESSFSKTATFAGGSMGGWQATGFVSIDDWGDGIHDEAPFYQGASTGMTYFNNTDSDLLGDYAGRQNIAFSIDLNVEFVGFPGAIDPNFESVPRDIMIELRDYTGPAGQAAINTYDLPYASVFYNLGPMPSDGTYEYQRMTYVADADVDGVANENDLGWLATNYEPGVVGKAKFQGDFNTDSQADLSDFGILAFNFGESIGSPIGPVHDVPIYPSDWETLSVTLDDPTSTALPAGWGGYGGLETEGGNVTSLPDGFTLADILAHVDEVVFTTVIPGYVYADSTVFEVSFDNISLSYDESAPAVAAVPEPGSLALLGLGGLALVRRRRG